MKSFLSRLALVFATLPFSAPLFSQTVPTPTKPSTEHSADARITGHIFKPTELPPPELSALKVPSGFKIERFAENLGNARLLAISPAGHVYVTRREQGDVLMLKVGGNGLADGPPQRVASRTGLHGIAFHEGKVYLATVHEIFRADVQSDGTFSPLEMIIHNLPDAGQHNTRTVQVGPDNMLYIGVGSTTNEALEPNPESATILRGSLDGKSRSIFASGLRDPIGWGWHPATGELWGVDHGIDWLGDEEQPEELNLIEKGKHYGWPFFYADNQENVNRSPPGGLSKAEWKKRSTPMVLGYTAHAAPMQLSFYTGSQFPAEYQGDAFVSMRGSWNRKPASGYEVVRIRFQNGKPQKIEPFVTGFITRQGEHGRLCGNAIAKDGSLLFSDDRNGIIYRVSSTRAPAATAPTPMAGIPAGPMKTQSRDGVKEPLSKDTAAAKGAAPIALTSPAFSDGQTIPVVHSAYDQNVSIPLRWSGAPAGTKSFALLMEDPDASVTPLPVVHWVAWNIPADLTQLREGLQAIDRLMEPMGLRQGSNYSGSTGYMGMRPPEGEPPHRYFLQLFAVDQTLDLLPGSTRKELLAALEGHVIGVGVLHGTFARPEKPKKP